MKKYSIGLDIGTTSVGWAVVDEKTFKIIKKGNKRQSMWGVRLFDEALSAKDRRNNRSTRRRYERRRQRIKQLQEIFKDEINKVDKDFYQKMHDSFYSSKDLNNSKIALTEADKTNIFGNNNRKISEKKYHTIYHIRNKIINSNKKEDIRLIYLAIHHIIKYRGNFLYNIDNFNVNSLNMKTKLEEIFQEIASTGKNISFNIEEIKNETYQKLENALLLKSINDKKILLKEILNNYFSKNFTNEFIKMIIGNQFDISKLFNIESEEEIKLSFKGTDYDDKFSTYEKILGDQISILSQLKELYDILFLKNLFGTSQEINISSLMIEKYNKHHKDLMILKRILKHNKKAYKEMFKDKNKDKANEVLCTYTKYINNKISYEELVSKLKKVLEEIYHNNSSVLSQEEYNKIQSDLENGLFLPKITNNDNGKYPYQLNKDELIKIIESQGKYYNFLTDSIIINGKKKYKLVQLLEFKIPYYVGPLNTNTNIKEVKNKNAWLIKKDNTIKITPFNFDEVINKEATAEKFITKMISNCTYLLNEKVIPANSILYSKYKVLNELKQIKINNERIPIELQHKIYNELFLSTDKTITEKIFLNYIAVTKEYSMYNGILHVEGYSDNKKFANNMKSYYDFFGENGIFKNTNYDINDAEEIIKWITIFEDKDILKSKIEKIYPNLNNIQVNKIISKKYTGWSNLSKKLLTEISYKDKVTGIHKTIMDLMWETNENFIQIIFNKEYNFQKKIDKLNTIKNVQKINYSLVENLITSPSTKRGIYQALKVVEEIVNYMGYPPANITIEMARNEEAKRRKDTRKEYLKKIYTENKKNIDNYNYLANKLETTEKIDTEKLFLYFIQLGKSMYSGEPLNINDLNSYEVDHIIPRTLIKDDSLDNKVLVLKEENQSKAANFIVPNQYRTNQMINWWKHLKNLNLISTKKFNNLCRSYYSEKDIEGFINRQLVETRQITKHVANILNNFYNDTNIIYLHANLSSTYREKYELFKYRELNDYHHAHDAYLASVLGIYQKYYLKKSTDFEKLRELNKRLYNNQKYNELKYGYVINSIDNEVSTFNEKTGEIIFDADYFNTTIKNTLYQNDILISKKVEIKTGEFYQETKLKKGNEGVPLKTNLDKNLYGSYTRLNPSYAIIVKYSKNNIIEQRMIGIPIYITAKKNEVLLKEYIFNKLKSDDINSIKIIRNKIPFYSVLNWKGQICSLVGATDKVEICNAIEFQIDKTNQIKWKYTLNRLFNNKTKGIENALYNEQLNELFNYIINKIEKEYKLYCNLLPVLKSYINTNTLNDISINNKEKIILELFKLLKFNSSCANLKTLDSQASSAFGKKNKKIISNATIIYKSVTGLKERKYEF